MRGTQSANLLTFATPDALPDTAARLFDAARSVFSSRAWWEMVLRHGLPPGTEPRFGLCTVDGQAAGLFPMQYDPAHGLRGLTTPYTCEYAPLLAPDANPRVVFETFGRFCCQQSVVRLDAMPAEWPYWDAMTAGLRAAGLVPRRFGHFGNWYDNVGSLDWTGYLARRPGALRETIRRRLRRAERLPNAAFTVIVGPEGLDQGIAAFEDVYARSWKEPEPFPAFNAASIRMAAAMGILRLGLWSIEDHTVAAQFWILEDGRATVLKLAHDEAYKAISPGTVLTALMLRHLLERESVHEIDFGRGDDPYKRDWVGQRRQRDGMLILNPRRLNGLLALARNDVGRLRRWWRSTEAV